MEQGPKRKSKTEKYCLGGLWVLTSIYGLLCVYLFYMQSIQPLDYNNRYFQSDLPYHISMVIEDGWYYSFTAYLYRLLYFPKSAPTILIAAVLAAVAAGTVLLTEKLLKKLTHSKGTTVFTAAGALLLNFVMPFFWRYAGMYRYVSYQSGNIWHNSGFYAGLSGSGRDLQRKAFRKVLVCFGTAFVSDDRDQAQFSHRIRAGAGVEITVGSLS